jgi:two-component system LytT family response regulator
LKKEFKILVADDEQPARKKVISFLKEYQKSVSIIEAENGKEAIDKIKSEKPDLVLLDIQMPGFDGFAVIQNVGTDVMPPVVFITAFDQYAINAFEVNAIDYLLKPFDKERFKKSFDRALTQISSRKKLKDNLKLLVNEIKKEKKYLDRIIVNIGTKYFFINVNEIIYISAEEKYIQLHTDKGKFLIRETMKKTEESLDPQKFARIHRSYIVNIEQIKEMQPWSHGDYVVILKNGEKLQMSRRFKNRLIS